MKRQDRWIYAHDFDMIWFISRFKPIAKLVFIKLKDFIDLDRANEELRRQLINCSLRTFIFVSSIKFYWFYLWSNGFILSEYPATWTFKDSKFFMFTISERSLFDLGQTYRIITLPSVAISSAKSVQDIALRNTGTYLYLPFVLRSGRGIVKNTAKQ